MPQYAHLTTDKPGTGGYTADRLPNVTFTVRQGGIAVLRSARIAWCWKGNHADGKGIGVGAEIDPNTPGCKDVGPSAPFKTNVVKIHYDVPNVPGMQTFFIALRDAADPR